MVKYKRGGILLFLDKDLYGHQGSIKGLVFLRLRKPVRARGLYVHLIGWERIYRLESSYNDTSSHYRLVHQRFIYKNTISIGGEGVYSSGEYSFEMPIPDEASSTKEYQKWNIEVVLDVSDGTGASIKRSIRFRKRKRYKRMSLVQEESEPSYSWVDMDDRRYQTLTGFKDTPDDEVYAEGVLFCPQCETPYHHRKGGRRCNICGCRLPKNEGGQKNNG